MKIENPGDREMAKKFSFRLSKCDSYHEFNLMEMF